MAKNNLIWIILAVVIGLLLLVFKYSQNEGKKYNWSNTLQHDQKEPYDISIFQKSLSLKYPSLKVSSEGSINRLTNTESTDYFAVGNFLFFKGSELDTLHEFIKSGNNAFLAYKNMSDTGLIKLGVPKEYLAYSSQTALVQNLSFTHPKLSKLNPIKVAHHISFVKQAEKKWQFFPPSDSIVPKGTIIDNLFDGIVPEIRDEFESEEEEQIDDDFQVYIDETFWYGKNALDNVTYASYANDILVNDQNKVILKRFRIGEGYLYIMLNPDLLGNFYASSDSTKNLLAGVLNHFNADKAILDIEATSFKMGNVSVGKASTPLSYMLSKTWFKIGLYALLCIALLFMVMQSFRKWRVQKIYVRPKNRSLEQIKDIAAVLAAENRPDVARKYYTDSFEMWHNVQNLQYQYGKNVEDPELKRCQILCSKEYWEGNDLKEFSKLYNSLIIKYGK